MRDFYKGMEVRVSYNLSLTDKYFMTGPQMHKLKGKIIKVFGVTSHKSIRAGEEEGGYIFSWHPSDLIPIENEPPDCVEFSPRESKITTFDPNHLDFS